MPPSATTSPRALDGQWSRRMMPRPRTSIRPAMAWGERAISRSPQRSMVRRSSATSRAPPSIRRSARSDLPQPEGPSSTTPAPETSTQLAWSSARVSWPTAPFVAWRSATGPEAVSRSMALRLLRQYPIDRVTILFLPQPALQSGIAQQAGDAGERLEAVGVGRVRSEQQENQVARLIIEGLEVDRLIEPGEQADQALELGHPGVRDGNAVTDPGGAETLALHQRLEQALRVEFDRGRGVRCQLLQHLTLAVAGAEIEDDAVWAEDVGNLDHTVTVALRLHPSSVLLRHTLGSGRLRHRMGCEPPIGPVRHCAPFWVRAPSGLSLYELPARAAPCIAAIPAHRAFLAVPRVSRLERPRKWAETPH